MNRAEFQHLSNIRLKEARTLFNAGLTDGAYYLAGYAAECALKACIAKRTQQFDFPDRKVVVESHTHNLTELMRLSELVRLLQSATQSDPQLGAWWTTVQEWTETSRYQISTVADATELLDALENPSGGILPWIRLHW